MNNFNPIISWILVVFLFVGNSLAAQDMPMPSFAPGNCDEDLFCVDFELILKRTLQYIKEEQADLAYEQLKVLQSCDRCPDHLEAMDTLSLQIIDIFARQQERLKLQADTLSETLKKTEETLRALSVSQRKEREQQELNKQLTKDALVEQYMSRAHQYLEQNSTKGRSNAVWLTDFTYHYVDSTHHDLARIMLRLANEPLVDRLIAASEEQGVAVSLSNLAYTGDPLEQEYYYSAIAWSQAGEFIAAGTNTGLLVLFDQAGDSLYVGQVSSLPISALAINASGDKITFQKDDYNVASLIRKGDGWTLTDEEVLLNSTIQDMAWSPVSNTLAVSVSSNELYVFEDNLDAPPQILSGGHYDWIRGIAWSNDGKRLVSGDDQGQIVIWDMENLRLYTNKGGHTDYIRSVDWHPTEEQFVSAGDDGTLLIRDANGQVLSRDILPNWILDVKYSADGSQIGMLLLDNSFWVKVGNQVPEKRLSNVICSRDIAWWGNSCTLDPSSSYFLKLGQEGRFSLSSTLLSETERAVASNELPIGIINDVAWSANGEQLAFGSSVGLGVIARDVIRFTSFGEDVTVMAVDWQTDDPVSQSNILATITSDGYLRIWNANTLEMLRETAIESNAMALEWSPNGEMLAIGDFDGNLSIYSADLAPLQRYLMHENVVRSLAWSPNGNWLASGSDDNRIGVVDMANTRVSQRIEEHIDWVRAVCWLDNDHLVSSADDNRTIIWENGLNNEFSILQNLPTESGYPVALSLKAGSEASQLAIGFEYGDIVFYDLDNSWGASRDTIVYMDVSLADVAWRPGGSFELALGIYGQVPNQLDRYLQLGVANEAENKTIETKRFITVRDAQAISIADYNHLPIVNLANDDDGLFSWSSNERWLAALTTESAGVSGDTWALELHDFANGGEIQRFYFPDVSPEQVLFSPYARYLALAGKHKLLIVNPTDLSDTLQVAFDSGSIISMAWSADEQRIAILDSKHQVWRIDPRNGRKQSVRLPLPDGVNSIQGSLLFHPTNNQRIYALRKEGVYEVTPRSAKLVFENNLTNGPKQVSFLPRGQWLENGKRLFVHIPNYPPFVLRTATDTMYLDYSLGRKESVFSLGGEANMTLYEIDRLQERRSYQNDDLVTAKAWSIDRGVRLGSLNAIRMQRVNQMALSSDGRYLASAGEQLVDTLGKIERRGGMFQVFDLDEQTAIFTVVLPNSLTVSDISFSPDGNYLTTFIPEYNFLYLWPLDVQVVENFLQESKQAQQALIAENTLHYYSKADVENWELERGVNFNADDNMDLLHIREEAAIRQIWSAYYIDKAWLFEKVTDAETAFRKAEVLHLEKDSRTRIRPSALDTAAMVNLYLEQFYFGLRQEQAPEEMDYLERVAQLRPNEERLQAMRVILDSDGDQVEQLLALLYDEVANKVLEEEYKVWRERDIRIKNESVLQRLRALVDKENDPISPLETPRMETLLASIDSELRHELMGDYFRANLANPFLENNADEKLFLQQAIAFLEDNDLATRGTTMFQQDYQRYREILQRLELEEGNLEASLAIGESLLAERKAAVVAPNATRQDKVRYLDAQGELLPLRLQLHPERVNDYLTEIDAARQLLPNDNDSELDLNYAHALVVAGQTTTARTMYYELMAKYDAPTVYDRIRTDLVKIISDESQYASLIEDLTVVKDYLYEQGQVSYLLNGYLPEVGVTEGYYIDYNDYQQTIAWYDKLNQAAAVDFVGSDSLQIFQKQLSKLCAYYTWRVLESGDWPSLIEPLETMERYDIDARWPAAVGVLNDWLIFGNWDEAKDQAELLLNVSNDGFFPDQYPTIGDFFRNLPESVKAMDDYERYDRRWRKLVEE